MTYSCIHNSNYGNKTKIYIYKCTPPPTKKKKLTPKNAQSSQITKITAVCFNFMNHSKRAIQTIQLCDV